MAAGLGYKEFTTGDILTAADANGYLASQVVMVFASAAARTSAIASPQEGMISYLKDTNSTEYYSGSAWAAIGGGGASGKVLQVVNVVYSTSSATSSTTFADTGLTASITPSASTSKVLVFINHNGAVKDYNNVYGQMKLLRGATTISSIGGVFGATNSSATNGMGTISTTYLDSPATTSSVTYKTQFACNPGSAEFRLQANVNGVASDSTITLMEIGA